MKKEFVPYELSVKLKALGFDEPCLSHSITNTDASERTWTSVIVAPLYQQAFRFFRENYKLHSHISLGISDEQDRSGLEYDEYIYIIEGLNGLDYDNYNESFFYKTHEEAELECLKKLIEILESKS